MSVFASPRFRLSGDRGLLVELGERIDPTINEAVRALAAQLELAALPGVLEIIPAYRSVMLLYDPEAIQPWTLKERVRELNASRHQVRLPGERTVEIPVCYGGAFGPDLGFVAEANGLTEEEVVTLHSHAEYPIYMLGFTPGFPYLGGLNPKLHTPRRKTPRSHVPRGSVGIANAQTGIYPVSSPGGWQLIGRTPLQLFRPWQDPPVSYKPGDRLRFRPVSPEEYQRLAGEEGHA